MSIEPPSDELMQHINAAWDEIQRALESIDNSRDLITDVAYAMAAPTEGHQLAICITALSVVLMTLAKETPHAEALVYLVAHHTIMAIRNEERGVIPMVEKLH
jgi:hypothetical protein